jgi:hypothetical protein
MKILLLCLASVLTFKAHAIQCGGIAEAQFIAEYSQVEQTADPAHTSFGLKNFKLYNMHGLCPLDIEQAVQARIEVDVVNAQIKDGAEVSGVLIYNSNTDTYSIY